ncbi:protein translocase subunit SecF, partial [Psychrobacter sp. 1Y4]
NGSNGDATTASTRRRNKPRRDGKGSNTKTNNPTTAKSGKSSSRRGGKGQAGKDNQALATTVDPNLVSSDAADDAAAVAEGGIKAIGNQRIIPFMKIEKPMALLSLFMVIGSIIAIAVNGLNLGLDFTGGVSADIRYEQPVEQVAVVQALADNGFDDAVVQYLGTREELL